MQGIHVLCIKEIKCTLLLCFVRNGSLLAGITWAASQCFMQVWILYTINVSICIN